MDHADENPDKICVQAVGLAAQLRGAFGTEGCPSDNCALGTTDNVLYTTFGSRARKLTQHSAGGYHSVAERHSA
eukprot:5170241-Prorocentrum_lima.AAC.1